ncbi:MAG: tetratricopeptide repeat protein, partial [bacterium]|nr:tetratricopeptide repeat protein [bacterium]
VMKPWHIWFSVFGILLFGFLLSRGYGDAKFLMREGNYYFGSGEYDLERAERAFQRAVRVEPGILWGHYQLARIYFIKGDFEKALREINKELEANPENLRALYVRGLIYGFSGKFAEAGEDFRRFVNWAPKEWAGYNDLAWVLSSRGKYKEAQEIIALAFREVSKAGENPWLWNSFGVAQLNLKEYREAKISFGKAEKLLSVMNIEEWRKAYPGNDPVEAESGLRAFRDAVEKNLQRAGEGV